MFCGKYIKKADEILGGDPRLQGLPAMFIEACMAREQKKLEDGYGHGHRDLNR